MTRHTGQDALEPGSSWKRSHFRRRQYFAGARHPTRYSTSGKAPPTIPAGGPTHAGDFARRYRPVQHRTFPRRNRLVPMPRTRRLNVPVGKTAAVRNARTVPLVRGGSYDGVARGGDLHPVTRDSSLGLGRDSETGCRQEAPRPRGSRHGD